MKRRFFLKGALASFAALRGYDFWQSKQPYTPLLPRENELCETLCFLAQETPLVCLGDTDHRSDMTTLLLGDKNRLEKMRESQIETIFVELPTSFQETFSTLQKNGPELSHAQIDFLQQKLADDWEQPYKAEKNALKMIEALQGQKSPILKAVDARSEARNEFNHSLSAPALLASFCILAQSLLLPSTLPLNYAAMPAILLFLIKNKEEETDSLIKSLLQKDGVIAKTISDDCLKSKKPKLLIYGAGHFEATEPNRFMSTFQKEGLTPLWINYYKDEQAKAEKSDRQQAEKRNTPDVCFIGTTEKEAPLSFKDPNLQEKFKKAFAKRPDLLALLKPAQGQAALSRRNLLSARFG